MKLNSGHRWLVASLVAIALTGAGAAAAQAPSTTQKVYGRTPAESSPPSWPAPAQAPKGAPNVLVILTDDVGFGASSTFGGPIPTPTFDALAQGGARYNAFNTTAICSPTRASLLTGRNPQAVGVGYVTNWPTGYDGYNSVIPRSAGTIAQILRANGYSTAMLGKSHLTPEWELSSAGPFDRWPTGLGFDYFYGFLGADTSMAEPSLVENTVPIAPPHDDPAYHLERDLADHAIRWLTAQHAAAPAKPFFLYYATGTAHAPNQAPPDWLAKFRGRFDAGWDAIRAQSVARQKALGVIPASADDAPRPDGLPRWDSLTPDQRRLYARHMEAYAAALAFADDQIGRVVAHLRAEGQLDDTMIVYIQGDNGASEEGGPDGKLFEQSALARAAEPIDKRLRRIDDIGTPASYPLYPAGWGWAMNAPFPWAKRYASHFGGTRNGMVIAWPNHIFQPRTVRAQFHHVSDILPTILDVAGVAAPATLDGVAQQPITGISLRYTFDHPLEPSHRTSQVFAMAQNLALYRDGWIAATQPFTSAWQPGAAPPIDGRGWQLYDLAHDFSEAHDLAAANPARLARLEDLFWIEAARSGILPIHPDEGTSAAGRPDPNAGRTVFTYHAPVSRIPESAAPETVGRSFEIAAEIVVPADGAHGALVAHGGRYGGYAFFLDAGRPVFTYKLTPLHVSRIAAAQPLAPGAHVLTARFARDAGPPGAGGMLTLLVDGKEAAAGRVAQTFPLTVSHTEGFDIGQDDVSPVDASYGVATSRFSGTLRSVTVRLK